MRERWYRIDFFGAGLHSWLTPTRATSRAVRMLVGLCPGQLSQANLSDCRRSESDTSTALEAPSDGLLVVVFLVLNSPRFGSLMYLAKILEAKISAPALPWMVQYVLLS